MKGGARAILLRNGTLGEPVPVAKIRSGFTLGKSAVSGAVQAVSSAVQSGQGASAAKAFGLDANDALAPVNQRLQAKLLNIQKKRLIQTTFLSNLLS